MIRRYSRNYNAGYFEESELVDSVELLVKSKFGENAELYANYWAIGKDGVEVGDGYMEKSEARQEARNMGLEISGVKAICEVWTPDNKYGPKLRTEGSTLRQALSAMKRLVNTKSASRLSIRQSDNNLDKFKVMFSSMISKYVTDDVFADILRNILFSSANKIDWNGVKYLVDVRMG